MHHMIPLADAEALVSGVDPEGLTHESTDPGNHTAQIVFRDTRVGLCYMIECDYSTDDQGVATYGFDTVVVEGNECVSAEPVIRQTQTVTRWVPIQPLNESGAEEAEQL